MRKLCSVKRCTVVATRVLVFDADPDGDGQIGIRAEAYACNEHHAEVATRVRAHADVDAEAVQ